MEKNYNEVIGLNNTFAGMSRDRWPFGITLAQNIKAMDKIINEYNGMRQAAIDKFVKRDENGEILGVLRDVLVNEGEAPRQERVKNPRRIDETEWNDREGFDKALAELNEQKVNLELIPVDVNTVYFNIQANRDMTIKQFIDSNMEPSLMLYLMDFGFFKNLEM